MTIEIKMLTLGLASTNAYIVGDTDTGDALVIDPVDNAEKLQQAATDAGWTIKLILATHAHFDHVLASKPLKEMTDAPFYIHEDCVPMLETLPQQGQLFRMGTFPEGAEPDRLFSNERETVKLGAIELDTLYTPGHAPGHVAFYMPSENIVFSGDTLFYGSIGRTDLPGGDQARLLKSIREELLTLPDETRVLPGHMRETTIRFERQHNPFLQ
jgi:glyoxylase-like metal-dependent hydrolase (beta-lactamase superfamily II)